MEDKELVGEQRVFSEEGQITSGVGDLLHVELELLLEPLDGVVKVLNLLPQVEVLAGQPAGQVRRAGREGRQGEGLVCGSDIEASRKG